VDGCLLSEEKKMSKHSDFFYEEQSEVRRLRREALFCRLLSPKKAKELEEAASKLDKISKKMAE